jgi:hypothetical protein
MHRFAKPQAVEIRPLGSTPRLSTNASETWKSERSYKPFSARLAFLRRFDPFRWYQMKEDYVENYK